MRSFCFPCLSRFRHFHMGMLPGSMYNVHHSILVQQLLKNLQRVWLRHDVLNVYWMFIGNVTSISLHEAPPWCSNLIGLLVEDVPTAAQEYQDYCWSVCLVKVRQWPVMASNGQLFGGVLADVFLTRNVVTVLEVVKLRPRRSIGAIEVNMVNPPAKICFQQQPKLGAGWK